MEVEKNEISDIIINIKQKMCFDKLKQNKLLFDIIIRPSSEIQTQGGRNEHGEPHFHIMEKQKEIEKVLIPLNIEDINNLKCSNKYQKELITFLFKNEYEKYFELCEKWNKNNPSLKQIKK